MANRVVGVKKSQFNAGTTISGSATFDFVENGSNIKITFTDLLSNLGVTGTIVQVGDSLDAPVLDPQGSVNGIRNIKGGFGITAVVNAQNSVEIATDFSFDTTGAELVDDVSAASPAFRSLVEGNAITLTEATGTITIGVDEGALIGATVIVDDITKLPEAVGGVITLDTKTDYLQVADISTSNRFVMSNNTLYRAVDSSQAALTYTGTGTMFTGVDVDTKIKQIELSCPNGQLFDFSATTPGVNVFQFVDATVASCDTVGTLNNLFATQFTDVAFLGIATDGVTFTGSHGFFIAQTDIAIIAAGTLFDLGTATFDNFSFGSSQVFINGSSVFLSGLTASGNINSGGLGTVLNTRFVGTGTPLSGVSEDDALWQFSLNDDIADTRPDGLLSMQGNTTETVITAASTDGSNAVLVAGTWVVETDSQMTGTTGGRLTYNGGKDSKLPITTTIAVEPASGTNVNISAYIAIGGVVVASSRGPSTASAGSPTSITIPWQEVFSTGTFAEVFVENNDTTANLLVSSAKHRVN